MSPFLFLLPLAPYPVLAYAAADEPLLLLLLLPLYFLLPHPLYALGGRLPGLPLEGLLRTGKRLGPYPAALGLPFAAYWLLAPQAWSFGEAYGAWGKTAGLGVPLSVLLGLLLGQSVPPLLVALVLFFVWNLLSLGLKAWHGKWGGAHG